MSHISGTQSPVSKSNGVPVEPVQVDTQRPTRFGMLRKFSLFVRLFFLWIFARVVHEPSQVQEVLAIPREETVVYLLASENRHDYLFLNDLCLKTGMPLAFTGNGYSKLKYSTLRRRFLGLFSKRKKRPSPADIATAVLERRPILLYLNQYGIHERENTARTEAIFEAITKTVQANPGLKVHFVPVGIIWERRAETYRHTLMNEFYGTPTRPSSIRRFLSVLPSVTQLFFQIGKPLCLIHHDVYAHGDTRTPTELRRQLNDDIDMMHTQVNGPKVKPHQQLLREIVSSDDFQAELRTISQSTGQSQEELVLEARKILDKTASKFSLLMCKVFCTVFTPMWSLIYNGLFIDTERLNEIRELSKTHRLVFIPSHKSHIDYLVLSILLFQHGVLPPHIVAGENLNFFPVGSILRRGGAFFIKRSFKGELLYTLCIRYYIDKILHEGFPIEFFIEGGRSRTGQVLQPKFGILRMIAQAVQADPALPVKIIPCAITYEKVIEDMAYKNEQDGAVKQKENFSNLIGTTKLLISKYGQIYVSFSDPIDMNEALNLKPETAHQVTDAELTQNIDVMATDLMARINQASTITTSSLLSCALLNAVSQPVKLDILLETAAFFLALLIERNALITPVLQTALAASRASLNETVNSDDMPVIPGHSGAFVFNMASESSEENREQKSDSGSMLAVGGNHARLVKSLHDPILETLKLFKHNGTIKKRGDDIEIATSGRLQMAFYKNILLYALIDDIYLAHVLIHESSKDEEGSQKITRELALEAFLHLADDFSVEFKPSNMDSRFDETWQKFETRQWLEIQGHEGTLTEAGLKAMHSLSRCIAHHLASYKTVSIAYENLTETIEESKFIANIMTQAKQDIGEGKLLPESCSKVVYSHAVSKLIAMGKFEVSYEQSGRKHAKFLKKI